MAANANANNNRNSTSEHVEFSVKAEEDLFLEGSEKTIKRVTAETNYSCLMLKSQRFSSLFRHYAKYHGLRKEELEYYFVSILGTEDTPEGVQLQRGDTITVRKKRETEGQTKRCVENKEFFLDMKDLLKDEEHMDCVFVISQTTPVKIEDAMVEDIHPTNTTQIKAHKAILMARSSYFKALFCRNTFREGEECTVTVDPEFTQWHVRSVLEFLYTNSVSGIRKQPTSELLTLLKLADQWLLPGLKIKVEYELTQHHISLRTVPKLYLVAGTDKLREACIQFIKRNILKILDNEDMKAILYEHPDLCIPVIRATAELVEMPQATPPTKKQRTRSPMDAPSSGII